jgi:23S rRNA (cytosine1962-C5)-methyltransferase
MTPLRVKKGMESAVLGGFPWLYGGELVESSELLPLAPGSLVCIENHKGQKLGIGYYNAHSQIACRVLTLSQEPIDVAFFKTRLEKALALRERAIGVPYYRLVHAESDALPGLLIDRFGDTLVVQVATAGIELLQPLWLAALEELLHPRTIILRNDIAARKLEGLTQNVEIVKGTATELVQLQENGCVYFADLLRGQKTGWFYDQRDNRQMIAGLAKDKTLLDVYAHSGGFAIVAAKAGARAATLVDSSALALELAQKAAQANGVAERCQALPGDALQIMQGLAEAGRRFDIVLADPPAFVKSKKDSVPGMKAYGKVARLAAALVEPGGLLFVASCSHHAQRGAFNRAVQDGVKKAGRQAAILRQTGAAGDHPKHPHLPQSEYLKGLLVRVT